MANAVDVELLIRTVCEKLNLTPAFQCIKGNEIEVSKSGRKEEFLKTKDAAIEEQKSKAMNLGSHRMGDKLRGFYYENKEILVVKHVVLRLT